MPQRAGNTAARNPQGLSAQFTSRPREIERMFQKMFRCNVIIDFVEMLIHRLFALPQITPIYTDLCNLILLIGDSRNLWIIFMLFAKCV